MMSKAEYRRVCDMEGRWVVQTRVSNNGEENDWMTVKHFTEKGEAGYYESKKWMEENL